MGDNEWLDEFIPQNRIRVHFVTERGRVTQILVVQYEALINDKWYPVVRYDSAHGFFHRDLLSAAEAIPAEGALAPKRFVYANKIVSISNQSLSL